MDVPVIDTAETGRNIKRLREREGLSVRDLQMALGLKHPQAIYRWQEGYAMPTVDHLVILAQLLNTAIDEILVTY